MDRGRGRDALHALVPLEQDPGEQPAVCARRASSTTGTSPTRRSDSPYGNQSLTWLDPQIIGTSDTYTPTAADVGKALYCAANVNTGGATVWKTAAAPEILSATNVDTSAARPSRPR